MAQSSASPYVELFAPDVELARVKQLSDKTLGDPHEVLSSALMTYRLLMINYVKTEMLKGAITGEAILKLLDAAGQLYLGRFNQIAGPVAVQAYLTAYQKAKAGDVPLTVIYALAEDHTNRIGKYYQDSSKEAVLRGFNYLVNQRIPQRIAAERALDALGLTPRQMSGYVAITPPGKVSSSQNLTGTIKERSLNYIAKSLKQRFKIFATQELHNLDQQAQQTAWMWMADHGGYTDEAKKVWLTAKDEKVCPQCGPMHNKRVGIAERFELPNGTLVYVPGVHPNCRCEARVIDPGRIRKDDWEEEEHPRSSDGRFTTKARQAKPDRIVPRFRPITVADRPDPAIEEMIAGAERLREQLRQRKEEKQAIKMPEAEEGIRMPETVRMPNISLPQESIQMPVTGQAPMSMPVRPGLAITPEERVIRMKHVDNVIRMAVADVIEQTKPEPPKPRKRRIKPTIHLEQPAFAIAFANEFDSDMKIDPGGRTFTTDVNTVSAEASRAFWRKIDDVTGDVMVEYGGSVAMMGADGRRYTATLDEDDIKEVVTNVAWGELDDSQGEGVTIDITWRDSDGNEIVDALTVGYLAEEWDLTSGDFEIYVMKLSEGHDSSLGVTHNLFVDSRYGADEWETSGNYIGETYFRDRQASTAPLRFVNLIPDLEEIDWEEEPD